MHKLPERGTRPLHTFPTAARLLLLLLPTPLLCEASDESRHDHNGKLEPYALAPPELKLSKQEESDLAAGKSIMQIVETESAMSRRLLMVRDIQSPAYVVMDRILDLDAYDRMVKGVDRVRRYGSAKLRDGTEEIRAVYDIHALHLKFKYFMLHRYDPKQRCLTFHLDYDRRSDLDDSVGYWYVKPQTDETCRVYYSCDTLLRGWVPGPVKDLLGKTALKQATTWVNTESLAEWKLIQEKRQQASPLKFVSGLRDALREKQDGLSAAWKDAASRLTLPGPLKPLKLQQKAGGADADEPRAAVGGRLASPRAAGIPRPFTPRKLAAVGGAPRDR